LALPIDTEVIETRLAMLAEHVSDLKALQRVTFDEYKDNKILRGYVERTLQVCVQICLDIGSHLIAEFGFRHPQDNKDVFVVLKEEGIIPEEFLPNLLNMAGFRNIMVHDYARVDNTVVYGILKRHLDDFGRYARLVNDFLVPHLDDYT
jgi:uncharacterized protein YutE (UPF0331/DUF86 family)